MTMLEKVTRKLQELSPGALLELFEVDVGSLPGHAGEEPLRLHAGTNELSENVIFAGHAYARWPVEAEGFESSTQGASPRPVLRLANASDTEHGVFSALLKQYGDLIRCPVRRILVLAEFIDAANFENGNPLADPSATTSVELWFVERKKLETPTVIELELASALDLEGVMVPRRQVVGATCDWPAYRGLGCGYNGTLYFNAQDEAVSDASLDVCSRTLKGCAMRHAYVVSWYEAVPVRYTDCSLAMQSISVLNNPTLSAESGRLFPSSWAVWRPPSKLRRKATVVDLYWEGFELSTTQKLLLLDREGTPVERLGSAPYLALWLELVSGSFPEGTTLRLQVQGWNGTNKAFQTLAERPIEELRSFQIWQVPFSVPATLIAHPDEEGGYSLPVLRCAPVIELCMPPLPLNLEAFQVPAFTLRVGQVSVGPQADYSSYFQEMQVLKQAVKVHDLPFGGFVGASLVRS